VSETPTWRCSACDTYNDAEARACAVCDTPREEAVPAPTPVPAAKAESPAKPPERPEPTRAEIVAGCGCLLFLAAAAVTLIVLLVINWSSIVSAVTSLGPSDDSNADGPCPTRLTELMPGDGGREGTELVAVYRREGTDPDEEYTLCRARSLEVYFFSKAVGESYADATEAQRIDGGYRVSLPPYTYHFVGDEMTMYENGNWQWEEELTPRSSPS
jgi:hypothetical protein